MHLSFVEKHATSDAPRSHGASPTPTGYSSARPPSNIPHALHMHIHHSQFGPTCARPSRVPRSWHAGVTSPRELESEGEEEQQQQPSAGIELPSVPSGAGGDGSAAGSSFPTTAPRRPAAVLGRSASTALPPPGPSPEVRDLTEKLAAETRKRQAAEKRAVKAEEAHRAEVAALLAKYVDAGMWRGGRCLRPRWGCVCVCVCVQQRCGSSRRHTLHR
jgi:hypothetical protein